MDIALKNSAGQIFTSLCLQTAANVRQLSRNCLTNNNQGHVGNLLRMLQFRIRIDKYLPVSAAGQAKAEKRMGRCYFWNVT